MNLRLAQRQNLHWTDCCAQAESLPAAGTDWRARTAVAAGRRTNWPEWADWSESRWSAARAVGAAARTSPPNSGAMCSRRKEAPRRASWSAAVECQRQERGRWWRSTGRRTVDRWSSAAVMVVRRARWRWSKMWRWPAWTESRCWRRAQPGWWLMAWSCWWMAAAAAKADFAAWSCLVGFVEGRANYLLVLGIFVNNYDELFSVDKILLKVKCRNWSIFYLIFIWQRICDFFLNLILLR